MHNTTVAVTAYELVCLEICKPTRVEASSSLPCPSTVTEARKRHSGKGRPAVSSVEKILSRGKGALLLYVAEDRPCLS